MFGFVQNPPPRIHRSNGNMQPIIFLVGKTHYFTKIDFQKRTILQFFAFKNALFYILHPLLSPKIGIGGTVAEAKYPYKLYLPMPWVIRIFALIKN